MSYVNFIAESRRLAILRLLDEAGEMNTGTLWHTVRGMGFKATERADLEADVDFLVQNGLVGDRWLPTAESRIRMVSCKTTGRDVARGHREVPGVQPRDAV